ncbi:MAG TPA: histidine phosphatase family protein [Acetobacteraceae bacterium]|nr:histidine phosphatase family protein [Acetobacteraceae bacterium]
MHQLLLLRHAKALRDEPRIADHARPLLPAGWRAAGAIRRAMTELRLLPDVALVSSSRRTLQTLEALEPFEETPLVEPLDSLYDATASEILDVLHRVPETARSVLVVGHNPGLHELARLLAGKAAMAAPATAELRRLARSYPTATLSEFAIPGAWGTLGHGGGRLLRFLPAADLPQMAS